MKSYDSSEDSYFSKPVPFSGSVTVMKARQRLLLPVVGLLNA